MHSVAKTQPRVKNTGSSSHTHAAPRRRKPPAKHPARRYTLDIGKHISLALTAAKYDFDLRLDGDPADVAGPGGES